MDEQSIFEPRPVLGRRRAGWDTLAILVPALLLAVVTWLGASGAGSDAEEAAKITSALAAATPSGLDEVPRLSAANPRPTYPRQVVGLDVRRLYDIQALGIDRHGVNAVAGWYVATAITECPRLAEIYRKGLLPGPRGRDDRAFCERSGVLYASRPDLEPHPHADNLEDNRSKNAGLPAVPITLVIGVVVPPELEMIGGDPTPVVVVGRFVESQAACRGPGCREFAVDHVAWAAGTDYEHLISTSPAATP